jgi:hypothetical protein
MDYVKRIKIPKSVREGIVKSLKKYANELGWKYHDCSDNPFPYWYIQDLKTEDIVWVIFRRDLKGDIWIDIKAESYFYPYHDEDGGFYLYREEKSFKFSYIEKLKNEKLIDKLYSTIKEVHKKVMEKEKLDSRRIDKSQN